MATESLESFIIRPLDPLEDLQFRYQIRGALPFSDSGTRPTAALSVAARGFPDGQR